MRAYCFRSGEIEFGSSIPGWTLPIGRNRSEKKLRNIVETNARHAYDGETLLVPGIPEADTEEAALAAWGRFRDLVEMRLNGRSGWPAQS